MKLVNPNQVGIERKFRFFAIFVGCDDFIDEYTDGETKVTGCFGCEHLSGGSYAQSCLLPKHFIKFAPIRKDEKNNNILGNCNTFIAVGSYNTSYLNRGCRACVKNYRGGGRWKCENKFRTAQEVFRIG